MRRRAMLAALALVSVLWMNARRFALVPARARPEFSGEASEEALLASRPAPPPGHAAVLLLAGDQKAASAASALESGGVPFGVTRDLAAALRQRLIVIPFGEAAVALTPALLEPLRRFVERGGTLVVQAPSSKDPWAELTGMARSQASRGRRKLRFTPAAEDNLAALSSPELLEIPLAAARSQAPWTRGLQTRPALEAEAVAVFDTGEIAVLRRRLGAGRVYTLGVDLRDVVLRPHAGRSFDAGRLEQGLEPGADAWALALLGWYQAASIDWVRLRAAPGTAMSMLALSHAVETVADEAAAPNLAAAEASLGARATWFFRAGSSGLPDEASIDNPRVLAAAQALAAAGHEIASHGVLHAEDFEAFPQGRAPRADEYRPTLDVRGRAQGADMAAEATISRQRLERALGSGTVQGLRAPGLAYPTSLAVALENAGYLYDSSLTQRVALSARPFRLPVSRRFEAETEVIELPVAFNDEERPRRPDGAAVARAASLAAAYEGLVVWALRPSASGAAQAVRRALVELPADVAVLRLVDVARFWRARSLARFSLAVRGKTRTLKVALPAGAPELSFEFARRVRSCRSSSLKIACEGRLLIVNASGPASGSIALELE